jgi:hypothetical protein
MSITNRSLAYGKSHRTRVAVAEVHERTLRRIHIQQAEAVNSTLSLLESAKINIMLLGITTRDIDTQGFDSVGPEFVLAGVITQLQNHIITPVPLISKSSSSSSLPIVGLMDIYADYAAEVRFRANRRPQKRIFMDLHSLEEELRAIQALNRQQGALLLRFGRALAPWSFHITSATRDSNYRNVEKRLLVSQVKSLQERTDELDRMLRRSSAQKESLKQLIDVLEEDHGKAIRVFTIVTLFFLPL